MVKHIFIINPAAGKSDRSAELRDKINAVCEKEGITPEIYITKAAGDMRGYILHMAEENPDSMLRFYIFGGDGSINEAVSVLAPLKNIAFGCVPTGSGNDFVKNFPDCDFNDIALQLNAPSIDLDLISVGSRYCVNVASVGFDATVAYNMQKFKRLPFVGGNAAYSISVIYSLMNKLTKNLSVTLDTGEVLTGNFLLTAVANGCFYGGHYKAAPYARVDDGMIDLCAITKVSRASIMKLIKIYEVGEHPEKLPELTTYKKCRTVKIYHKKPLKVNIDGEIFIINSPEFKMIPAAIKFITPVR